MERERERRRDRERERDRESKERHRARERERDVGGRESSRMEAGTWWRPVFEPKFTTQTSDPAGWSVSSKLVPTGLSEASAAGNRNPELERELIFYISHYLRSDTQVN